MQRRKFVIGMGALASGTAAAIGSGAFTTTTADRRLEVAVAGDDAEAFLALDPQNDRVELNEDGAIEIDLADGVGETGLNPNGFTDFLNLFTITNQSTNELVVMIDGLGDLMDIDGISVASAYDTSREHEPGIADTSGDPQALEYDETVGGANYKIPSDFEPEGYFGDNDYPVLEPSESIEVGLYFQTDGDANEREYLDTQLTIAAVAVGSERDFRE
ncbi:hypothetical protein ACLI4Y_07145 [Natrialbaceae archaeon A-CW3]